MRNEVDSTFLTRPHQAGALSFVVRCPSERVRSTVQELLADLDDAPAGVVPYELVLAGTDGELSVGRDGAAGPRLSPDDALGVLLTTLTRASLDAEPERLHLHAAGLAKDGRGVIISAPAGTGKSTLATVLSGRGWQYLSDEALALAADSDEVTGFPKPLLMKPSGRELVSELEEAGVAFDSAHIGSLYLPASRTGARTTTAITPALVVFLARAPEADGDATVAPVHAADAAVYLLQETMDAERFGHGALRVLCDLAARCDCFLIHAGSPSATAEAIEELVEHTGTQTTSQVTPVAAEPVHWHGAVPSTTVRSAIIDQRAVLHDLAGGAIAALDEAGTAVWLALHGAAPSWWTPAMMEDPAVGSFLTGLEHQGFLVRTEGAGTP